MSLRLKRIIEDRHPADRVFSNSDFECVDSSDVTIARGLEVALFLQFHDARHEQLPDSEASARIAYRNYRPHRINITRALESQGGAVETHDPSEELKMSPRRSDRTYYSEGFVAKSVLVHAEEDETEVTATLRFVKPPDFFTDREELTVRWPEREREFRCACCLRSYRTSRLSSSTG
jgi:hypothetical protein